MFGKFFSRKDKFIVFLYHALSLSDNFFDVDYEDPVYTLVLSDFRNHCIFLSNVEKNKFLLTFDDGHISNYTLAFPCLLEYNLFACFFLICDFIDRPGFLSREMMLEMSKHGMDFGSHGLTHRFFTELTDKELYRELEFSKKRLEDILGKPILNLSCPGGRFDRRVIHFAFGLGYNAIYTSVPKINYKDNSLLGRISVTRKMSVKDLESFLEGKLLRLQGKYYSLLLLKSVLGSYYPLLRHRILKFFKE